MNKFIKDDIDRKRNLDNKDFIDDKDSFADICNIVDKDFNVDEHNIDDKGFFENHEMTTDATIQLRRRSRGTWDITSYTATIAAAAAATSSKRWWIQNEKIIIDRHVDDHSLNVLHCHFESSNVIRDVLIVDENDDSKLDQHMI